MPKEIVVKIKWDGVCENDYSTVKRNKNVYVGKNYTTIYWAILMYQALIFI